MRSDAPLAIDLYCGLLLGQSKPKFCLTTNAAIQEFVACRAENPYHVRLRVGNKPPSTIAPMFGAVSYLKNASLAARLAATWHFGPSIRKSIKRNVLELTSSLIEGSALLIFASCPLAAKLFSRSSGTHSRAVPLICARRSDVKVLAALAAIPSVFCCALMFVTTNATGSLCAVVATPLLIGFLGLKLFFAKMAN